MSDPSLEPAARALAEATPRHLGKPTTPPISWRREGDGLKVILADGRAIYGPMPEPSPKGKVAEINLADGVNNAEASLAGKALQARVGAQHVAPTPTPKPRRKS